MREAHLRDFIAVIETGSVRAAARKLGLTQAAVSKNLSALERSIGVPLLVRSTQGVETTEEGRVVLRRARIVDSELRKLQEELDELAGGGTSVVTIGLSATAEAMLLPQALTRFHARSGNAAVSVIGGRSASTVAALREARIDFAIGPLPVAELGGDLHAERLCSSDLGVVARAGHPLARATRLEELMDCTWAYGVQQSDGKPAVVGVFRDHGLVPPRVMTHCDSSSALISILLQTDVVTLTSLAALEPLRRHGLLAVLPIPLELPQVVQHLITASSRPLTASAESLAAEFRRASRGLRR